MDAKKDFFGYGENEVRKQPDWWIDKIHPADVDRINLAIRNILSGNAQSLQEEYRFRCADGTYRYVFSRGILIKEENSTNQMVGAMMDITEHKKLKNELLETHLRFQKQLTEATILGQEKEKEEIGKELHDNINQILVFRPCNQARANEGRALARLQAKYILSDRGNKKVITFANPSITRGSGIA
jgi:two-component system sensor histidine kinase UhpB